MLSDHTPARRGCDGTEPETDSFFIAFVPHFIDPTAPLLPQFSVTLATFTSLAWLNAYLYARLAGQLSGAIRRPSIIVWFKRASGNILISMGLVP